jgi:CopG family nickel-responsive transcriptional regulator
MQRITITVDDDLMAELDHMIEHKGYANRSEAIRDLARAGMKEVSVEENALDDCVGVLSYVYKHEARDLAKRLTSTHHDHHHISIASLHVHLNEDYCLEISLLRGQVGSLKTFADSIISQRSIVHGDLAIIPAPE